MVPQTAPLQTSNVSVPILLLLALFNHASLLHAMLRTTIVRIPLLQSDLSSTDLQ
jgi:hypothetical protein